MTDCNQAVKIKTFAAAMEKYHKHRFYRKFPLITSYSIIISQLLASVHTYQSIKAMSGMALLCNFICAYLLTDFINGLVHLYMDNNTNYNSLAGPFIAAFHLHHNKPRYKNQSAFKVYFYETGGKFWLLPYMIIILFFQFKAPFSCEIDFILTSIGILSSFAEVSHYWCHNATSNQVVLRLLQKYYILLPKKHHAFHHRNDNTHYAFLNGLSDPLINIIARYFYSGYKNASDQHAKAYANKQMGNH